MQLMLWRKKKPELVPAESMSSEVAEISNVDRFKITSCIAENVISHGALEVQDSILVNGTINGGLTVHGKGRAALIKQSGAINGAVQAPIVMVAGVVRGDIRADDVRLYPTARVYGRVYAKRMRTDLGAQIINNDFRIGVESDASAEVHPINAAVTVQRDHF